MPLLLLLYAGAAGPQVLAFVDSTGVNPLPPGVIVTLTASGRVIGKAMLQAGGICPIPITNGKYTATFIGTQAPTSPVTFTAGVRSITVTVPNYQSPTLSTKGYAIEGAAHLVRGWFQNPAGT